MAQGSKFSTGKFSKFISDRDGFKYDYSDGVIEPDTKLFVHRDEVDDPDPYRRLRSRQDAIALRNPRPDIDSSEDAGTSNCICLSQSATGAQALILNGANVVGGVATLDSGGNPRIVAIASVGNDIALNFIVTGTVLPGAIFTEVVGGSNKGIAYSSNPFYTVASIVTSGATASTVTVGIEADGTEFDNLPVG